jgi:multiple sugar transport system substrate-binding protein
MEKKSFSRREMLKFIGAGSMAAFLASCGGGAAPQEAAAPAAKEEAAAPAAKEEAAAPEPEMAKMSVATFAAVLHDWQREFSKRWAEENPNVDLAIEEVVYNEMPKLQLARSASGTLWDITFSGIKWFPFSASKGMFLALDDALAARDDANLDDFFATALGGGKLDGTLYGLPYEIHPGNPALVVINTDMLEEKGLEMPTDDWNVAEYAELASQMSDPDNNVFGTNYLPGNYYDFESLARAYNTSIYSDAEHNTLQFTTDPMNVAAAQWTTDLRVIHEAAPSRNETEGLQFAAGTLATQVTGSYSVNSFATEIGDKFNHDWVLFPKGPDGGRGYSAFTSNYSVYAETAHPDLAVDLLVYLSSTEAGTWSALEQGTGQPNARQSVWGNKDLLAKSHPIFERVLNTLYLDTNIQGPFPMPGNLRHQEVQDNWANTYTDVFYGEVPFDEGWQNVQDAMQEILDLPRA